ncbi:hypothetical protein BX600DRAFT_433142 [Xylariales sp. PMI_506]|nr:hypothetical protein BX600DRAFT_433142 [Xylariales sp. PMI_506]
MEPTSTKPPDPRAQTRAMERSTMGSRSKVIGRELSAIAPFTAGITRREVSGSTPYLPCLYRGTPGQPHRGLRSSSQLASSGCPRSDDRETFSFESSWLPGSSLKNDISIVRAGVPSNESRLERWRELSLKRGDEVSGTSSGFPNPISNILEGPQTSSTEP